MRQKGTQPRQEERQANLVAGLAPMATDVDLRGGPGCGRRLVPLRDALAQVPHHVTPHQLTRVAGDGWVALSPAAPIQQFEQNLITVLIFIFN